MAVIDIQSDCSAKRVQLGAPSAFKTSNLNACAVHGQTSCSLKYMTGKSLQSGFLNTIQEPLDTTIVLTHETTFSADYYNRIHIVPSQIDVGNLVSDQYFNVVVWNAYFYPRTLESITQSGTSGISLIGPTPPSVWGGLQTKQYQLTVTTDGSPDINASYLFNWDGTIDDYPITIKGSRIVSLQYPFEAPAKETLEWKTQVIISNNGLEQRIRLRKAPRQFFSVSYPLQNSDLTKAQNRAYGWITRRWAVPLWSEAQKIADLSSGITSIPVATSYTDLRANTLIYVYESNDVNATLDIDSVTTNAVALKRATQSGYKAPWVMPVRIGSVKGSMKRVYKGYQGALQVDFQFSDNQTLGDGATPQQFLGYDIYFDEILMGEEMTDELFARIDEIDYDVGKVSRYSPWDYTRIKRPFEYILQGMQEIWTFRKWLHRRAGRLRPFWTPTFESDLRLQMTGNITTALTVSSDDYKLFANDRSHLAIQLTDNTWVTKTITGITDLGNGLSSLTLDVAFNTMTASQIKRICFLGLKRLDTDRVEMRWDTNRTLYCTLPIVEIKP